MNTPDVSTGCSFDQRTVLENLWSFQPIHVNPYFSDFASFPATITHGMWSSAANLQCHGTPQGLTTHLANGYSLNIPDVSTTFNAPLTNKPYSKISGDFNPIHVNPYFSDSASFPATITHGMWSSAANLQCHGTPQSLTTPLANCSLNTSDVSTTFNAPLTNKPYSKISTPFTLTFTSLILHLSLLLSLTECGQVPQPAAMLKVL